MKAGKFWGIIFAFALITQTTSIAADDATITANRSSRFSGIFQQLLKSAITNFTQSSATAAPSSTNAPTTRHPYHSTALDSIAPLELSAGIKEAISNGLTRAVMTLGRTNGFLTNALARIPMPAQFGAAEKMLHAIGQDRLVDQFVASMNHAAEEAVPVATGIFADSLTQMTIGDARNLLLSPSKTAATEYFRRTTTNELTEKFLPIVRNATEKTGVTAAYKELMAKIPIASTLLTGGSFDIDQYVTSKALDGLFTIVADEEVRIRENPQARVTQLLQKVFGAVPETAIGGPPTTETGQSTTRHAQER